MFPPPSPPNIRPQPVRPAPHRRYHIAQLIADPDLCLEIVKQTKDPVVRAYYLELAAARLVEQRDAARITNRRWLVLLNALVLLTDVAMGTCLWFLW